MPLLLNRLFCAPRASYMPSARRLLRIKLLVLSTFLTACVASGVKEVTQDAHLSRRIELTQTPFYPQEADQCGPAALATALNAIDIQISPASLKPEVYLPSRKGSLQIEMLAAARRHGAFSMQIPAHLSALFQELEAGHVVIVMQNLGFSIAPSWHYAVLVGYDLDRELVWLRSGTYARFEMSLSAFSRTWARSQQWAMVALSPGDIPVSVTADALADALVVYEKTAQKDARFAAYQKAVSQHPNHLVLLIGLGNSAYIMGDHANALNAFQKAVLVQPQSVAAHNNLAQVYLDGQDHAHARHYAELALALAQQQNDITLQTQVQATLDEIAASKP